MQAIRIHDFGGSEVLELEEAPRPQPGGGELLVAVRAIGVNPVDWKIREGHLRQRVHLPLIPGQDFAGEVAETGPEPRAGMRAGARVFGFAHGAYAEFALAAGDEVAAQPDGLSFDTAAALPTPGLTADQMLTRAGLRPGERVLIHGAAGSVGSLATQLAKIAEAFVIATVRGQADAAYAAGLDADVVVDNERDRFEDVGEVNAIIDLIGGEVQRRSWKLLRPGGILVSSVGLAGGAEQEKAEHLGIRGDAFFMDRDPAGLGRLADLAVRGQLQIRIARVLPFPQARQAQDLSQAGAPGKILMSVA